MVFKFACLFGSTAAIGTFIAWEEVGPTMKSMEPTLLMIAVPTLMIGAFIPGKCLVWMLTLIAGTALLNIVLNGNISAIFSIGVAAIGTFVGSVARKAIIFL